MKRLLLLIVCFILFISCNSQDCHKLPVAFSSYTEAIQEVKSSTFQIKESADVSGSSWITSAKWYSCEGQDGYFIYTTNRGYEYIHKGVPLFIWKEFKNASSKGSYYDTNIKGRYRLPLN
jgi:KTSC domain